MKYVRSQDWRATCQQCQHYAKPSAEHGYGGCTAGGTDRTESFTKEGPKWCPHPPISTGPIVTTLRGVPVPEATPLPTVTEQRTIDTILHALRSVEYGSVTVDIQAGQPVLLRKVETEKLR